MLAALSEAIEARDPYARGHARRVTALAEAIAYGLEWDL
jgi:HD-GYP domain-containing protein (c-di-GMP phosphodiesterase class II)